MEENFSLAQKLSIGGLVLLGACIFVEPYLFGALVLPVIFVVGGAYLTEFLHRGKQVEKNTENKAD